MALHMLPQQAKSSSPRPRLKIPLPVDCSPSLNPGTEFLAHTWSKVLKHVRVIIAPQLARSSKEHFKIFTWVRTPSSSFLYKMLQANHHNSEGLTWIFFIKLIKQLRMCWVVSRLHVRNNYGDSSGRSHHLHPEKIWENCHNVGVFPLLGNFSTSNTTCGIYGFSFSDTNEITYQRL